MQKVAFKTGETIISEGDEGDTAFFIVSGAVDVAVGRGDNARVVGRLGTGEVFGEMSLIDPGPRSATVTASCDTECLAASYQDFIAAIEENPERAVGFMKTLVRRLRKTNELLECGSPEGRGFREMLLDCQPSVGSPEASALPWTMLW
jgi:CRP/FNR family cyclic AMP-dependent transcriptional regulator